MADKRKAEGPPSFVPIRTRRRPFRYEAAVSLEPVRNCFHCSRDLSGCKTVARLLAPFGHPLLPRSSRSFLPSRGPEDCRRRDAPRPPVRRCRSVRQQPRTTRRTARVLIDSFRQSTSLDQSDGLGQMSGSIRRLSGGLRRLTKDHRALALPHCSLIVSPAVFGQQPRRALPPRRQRKLHARSLPYLEQLNCHLDIKGTKHREREDKGDGGGNLAQ